MCGLRTNSTFRTIETPFPISSTTMPSSSWRMVSTPRLARSQAATNNSTNGSDWRWMNPCRPANGEVLKGMRGENKPYLFALVQKFNHDVDPTKPYSERDDIIVITDEAHRTQYGRLALDLRNALPNASYIGFTGTPLF